jgi:hypothetical protein
MPMESPREPSEPPREMLMDQPASEQSGGCRANSPRCSLGSRPETPQNSSADRRPEAPDCATAVPRSRQFGRSHLPRARNHEMPNSLLSAFKTKQNKTKQKMAENHSNGFVENRLLFVNSIIRQSLDDI